MLKGSVNLIDQVRNKIPGLTKHADS
jgi:hypothetical protein